MKNKIQSFLFRSFMFLPAYNERYIRKALQSKADALILDLEDSVPIDKRGEALRNIKAFRQMFLDSDKHIFVRTNAVDSLYFAEDIAKTILSGLSGFMLPKINDENDIIRAERVVSEEEQKNGFEVGKFVFAPLIETAGAVMFIKEICDATDRLVALCFGGEDYLTSIGATYYGEREIYSYPRSVIVNAARAMGLVPVDTPFLQIQDVEELKNDCMISYREGFEGRLILNPIQIETANMCYSPEPEELDFSIKILEKYADEELRKGKQNIVVLDGTMIGPPMKKRAEYVVNRNVVINKRINDK